MSTEYKRENKVLVLLWKQFQLHRCPEKASVTQRSSDYSCSAAGLKCGNGMRGLEVPCRWRGFLRVSGEQKVSVGACRRHPSKVPENGVERKRWGYAQTRQGLPCCSRFRMHPRGCRLSIPLPLHQVHDSSSWRAGQDSTDLSWPSSKLTFTSSFLHSRH